MNIDELTLFLIAEVTAKPLNWQIKKIGDMVFVDVPDSSPSNHHAIAIISFFRTPPILEVLDEGVENEATINGMWIKYQFLKDACLLLQSDVSKRDLNWHVTVSDNNIDILGPNRNQDDADKIATIFFKDNRWCLEIFNQDLSTKEIVLRLFSKRIEIPYETSTYSVSKDDTNMGQISTIVFPVGLLLLVACSIALFSLIWFIPK